MTLLGNIIHNTWKKKELVFFLKCKFYSLAKTKAKTGDPTIPIAAAKAKSIHWDIIQETDGLTSSTHLFAELEMSKKD